MDVVIKSMNHRLKQSQVIVHLLFILYVVFDDLVIIFSEEPVHFILLESQPVHTVLKVVLSLVNQCKCLIVFIDLVLKLFKGTLVVFLVLFLPDLSHCDPLVDLVEYLIASLLLIETRFHVL